MAAGSARQRHGDDREQQQQQQLASPVETVWLDVALLASRTLPGHFGHDVLNNALYVFNTFWEFELAHWLEPATLHPDRAYVLVDDDSATTYGDAFLTTINYNMNEGRYAPCADTLTHHH
jgi:hypothetical protein